MYVVVPPQLLYWTLVLPQKNVSDHANTTTFPADCSQGCELPGTIWRSFRKIALEKDILRRVLDSHRRQCPSDWWPWWYQSGGRQTSSTRASAVFRVSRIHSLFLLSHCAPGIHSFPWYTHFSHTWDKLEKRRDTLARILTSALTSARRGQPVCWL